MKNLLLISTLILLFTIGNLAANTKIVFVDLEMVMSASKPGINLLKQLDEIKDKDLKEFDKQTKSLKTKENKLISQKNILSTDDFQTKVKELKDEIKKYNDYRKNKVKNFKKIRSENTQKFLELINPILMKYSNDGSISMILRKKNVIIGKSDLDITQPIIELVNKNIKNFEIK